jgi:hypothetical protein
MTLLQHAQVLRPFFSQVRGVFGLPMIVDQVRLLHLDLYVLAEY